MNELAYAAPRKQRGIVPFLWPIVGAVLFPISCIVLALQERYGTDILDYDLAPAARLISFPIAALVEFERIPPVISICGSMLYLAIVGALMGWAVAALPRRLLTARGVTVCWMLTVLIAVYAGLCVWRCQRHLLPIPWINAYPEQAAAIHWSFYAGASLIFTLVLTVLYRVGRPIADGTKPHPPRDGSNRPAPVR